MWLIIYTFYCNVGYVYMKVKPLNQYDYNHPALIIKYNIKPQLLVQDPEKQECTNFQPNTCLLKQIDIYE